jgi:hypothetical protein
MNTPALAAGNTATATDSANATIVESFDAQPTAVAWSADKEAKVKTVQRKGQTGSALEVTIRKGQAGGVTLKPTTGAWDWTAYAGLEIDVEDLEGTRCPLVVTVKSLDADGRSLFARRTVRMWPAQAFSLPFFFKNGNAGPYWGMRGIPVYGPLTVDGFSLDDGNVNPSRVTAVGFSVAEGHPGARLRFDTLRVFPQGSPEGRLIPHPFIDRFGQFAPDDWPGKVHDEAELKASDAKDLAALDATPALSCMDAFGGWADGPAREATSRFRTEQIDGKWWLITPEGRLFFSLGVNCIYSGQPTFTTGREDWFEWLPEPGGEFASLIGSVSGVHSMGEAIAGNGRTANFLGINLQRKYGADWWPLFYQRAFKRLRAWGFNTVGNWSGGDVLANSPLPFTVTLSSGHARPLEGGDGYWGRMRDVFDPAFIENTMKDIAQAVEPFRDNPKVVGYFVDNELSWDGVAEGAIKSPSDQPARLAFIEDLKAKYGSLDAVNGAWGAQAADWDALRIPRRPSAACRADVDAFEFRFADRYFGAVAEAVHTHAAGHLYLGCRFALAYAPPVALRACAAHADVVSVNSYSTDVKPDRLTELGKPIIIGEFHFGALDRGMFHTGLVASENQDERARKYVRYVESVAANPAFVGCHWFEYADQPLTGRAMDGENYNIGLVSIADVPYPELTAAARALHGRLYPERFQK